ncbi:MAG: XdhC family protein [Xanthomonadales bacterium]|nr:XdhC family protein [Xanthomonadales bacterium]
MSERLWRALAQRLAQGEPCVVASVVHSRGATPRGSGSRMLIGSSGTVGSVGGGQAEARVLDQASRLLASSERSTTLALRLDGSADAVGVCGGQMRFALRRWSVEDSAIIDAMLRDLAQGQTLSLDADSLGATAIDDLVPDALQIQPDPRLLICGLGHCGRALYEMAQPLDFDLAVHDAGSERLDPHQFPEASLWLGPPERLQAALATGRQRLVVLLNRDYPTDVAQLRVLAALPHDLQPDWIGLMGSRRRLATVRDALRVTSLDWSRVQAPIGLAIGAQTPHEIAISILGQLIAWRNRPESPRSAA